MTDAQAKHSDTPPHIWTIQEIQAMREFGASQGWFYGLVEIESGDEKALAITEIFPGMGYTLIDRADMQTDPPEINWEWVFRDLQTYAPEKREAA